MRKILLCLIHILFLFYRLHADDNNTIDSLLNVFSTETVDSNKVYLLIEVAWEYHRTDPNQTINYAEKALNLAEEAKLEKWKIKSLNLLGIGHNIVGESTAALAILEEAANLAEKNNLLGDQAALINNMGIIYREFGQYHKSYESHLEAADIARQMEDYEGLAVFLLNVGKSLKQEKLYKEAYDYYQESLSLTLKYGTQSDVGDVYSSLGDVFHQLDKPDSAFFYYDKALSIQQNANDFLGPTRTLNRIGKLYEELGQISKALATYQEAFDLVKSTDIINEQFESLENIASIHFQNKDYPSTISYGERAIQLYQDTIARDIKKDIYQMLAESYVEVGNYQKAYELFRQHKIINDYLVKESQDKELAEMKFSYQLETKEAENQLLKAKESEQMALISRQRIGAIATAIGFLLVSVLAYFLFQGNRRKQEYSNHLEQQVSDRTASLLRSNKKLQESYNEMEHFTYMCSHDLKEPLRNINSFSQLLERRLGHIEDKDVKECIYFISANISQMNKLIEDILEFTKIKKANKEIEMVNFNAVISNIQFILAKNIEEKNAQIKADHLPELIGDTSQILFLFKNLIENGIKYNESESPLICISYTQNEDGKFQFSVQDNGIGIPSDYHNRIFEMFQRLHHRMKYQGSGLGLAICKKIVEDYDGKIWVESAKGKGSTFYFTLPKGQK